MHGTPYDVALGRKVYETAALRRQSDSVAPSGPSWEDLAVFNPAAWYDEKAGEVLLLYRAAESGPEYKCYFGLAKSRDGYHFERVSDEPVLSPSVEGFDGATIQDPRMIKMDGWYYVTYAARHYPFGQFWIPEVRKKYITPAECPECFPRYLRINATLTGLLLTRDFKTWIRAGWLTDPLLDDRDVILFPEKVGGKYVMLHRPLEWVGPQYGVKQASAWISFADDLMGFRAEQAADHEQVPVGDGQDGRQHAADQDPARLADDSITPWARTSTTGSARCCWTSTTRASSCTARPTGSCSRKRTTRSRASIAACASHAARS